MPVAARLASLVPLVTLASLAAVADRQPPLDGAGIALLVVAGIAGLFIAWSVPRASRDARWLTAAAIACVVTLACPFVAALLATDATPVERLDPPRLAALADLASGASWGLLLASALGAGLSLGVALDAYRAPRHPTRGWVVAGAIVSVTAVVALTSPGVDLLDAALRWGPLAWGLTGALIGASSTDETGRGRFAVVAAVPIAIAVVLATRGLAEANVVEIASRASLHSKAGMVAHAAEADARVFGWLVPLVPLAAAISWLALRRRDARSLLAPLAAALIAGAVLHAGTRVALDDVASDSTHLVTAIPTLLDGPRSWRVRDGRVVARVDPASEGEAVGPLMRFAEVRDVLPVLVQPDPDVTSVRASRALHRYAPLAARVYDAEATRSVVLERVDGCDESPPPCRALRGATARLLDGAPGHGVAYLATR